MTNIIWKTDFLTTLALEDELIPNGYSLKIELIPNTKHVEEQAIALERLRVFCETIVSGSILSSFENKNLEKLMETYVTNVMFLPDDPYDQLFTIILHSKLSAILEQRCFITNMSLSSTMGNLEYVFDSETFEYPDILTEDILPGKCAWWGRPDISTMDIIIEKDDELSIHDQEFNWEHIGLTWDGDKEKEGKIIDVKKFKPKVIDGSDNI